MAKVRHLRQETAKTLQDVQDFTPAGNFCGKEMMWKDFHNECAAPMTSACSNSRNAYRTAGYV